MVIFRYLNKKTQISKYNQFGYNKKIKNHIVKSIIYGQN